LSDNKKSLEAWVEDVTENEMPVFGRTVQSVIRASDSDSSSVSELAQVILQDSAMTARVLKLVNTIYYNPSSQPISTVSRAIVLLGFEAVRNICITVALIDSMVTGGSRERLAREMAVSIHAAIQARSIAEQRGDVSPEEIFIATMLFNIGQMAFWCFGDKEADQLDQKLKVPDVQPEAAEREVLGFPLRDMTKSLAKEWHLNDLLQEAVNARSHSGARAKNITISHKLAVASEKGWDSEEVETVMKEVAEVLGQPVETITSLLHEGARDAVSIAGTYGAASIAKIIPLPPEYEDEVEIDEDAEEEVLAEQYDKADFPEPDPMLQLDILSEIKELINERPTFNALLEMVLEGIYRGIGMDRTLFALMTPDHKTLKAKFALGAGGENLVENFAFSMDRQKPNLFLYAMAKKKPLRYRAKTDYDLARMITPEVQKLLGDGDCLVAPLLINGKAIGAIYADRMLSKREVDERTFRSFDHFAAEANMGLDYITNRRN
jgi:HD-like signal output (HDOD) protein